MDCSPPGSSVHGISQTKKLEWVAISLSYGSSGSRDWTRVSFIGRWILYHWATSTLKCLPILRGWSQFVFFFKKLLHKLWRLIHCNCCISVTGYSQVDIHFVDCFWQVFNTSGKFSGQPLLPSPLSTALPWTTVNYLWVFSDISQTNPCLFWIQFSSVQSLSRVLLSVTPWTSARQASLSITNSWSLLKLMPIESVMPSSHLILCHPLLFLPPIPPSIRVFSNESTLRMRWPKYWSFSFSISPSSEYPGLISFRMDWLDLLAVQGTLKTLSNTTVQKHQFFSAQLSLWSNSRIHTWPLEKT